MTKHPDVEAVVNYLQQGPDRSSLFWWLAENHDALLEANGGKPIRWGPLASCLASFGLTDRDGKPAMPETVRQTWKRVRQFVAEQAAAKRDRARTMQPSRMPATWRPQPADPPGPRPPDAPRDRTGDTASSADANIARLYRTIEDRST